jgi:glutathione S-transferase
MTDLILHHYELSPFSEKIRALLGYADLSWQSVSVREFPPRPELDRLTGGYRKIPVAQIGADIFCDTRTISSEIAALAGKPELALENCDPEVRDFVARADLEVFLACVLSANGRNLLRRMRRDHSWLHVGRLMFDRINMARKAKVKAAGPKEAGKVLDEHLQDLEHRLERDFLFGDQPNTADFAAYHGLWFIRDASDSSRLAGYPEVNAWMDRIAAFGHGRPRSISTDEARQQACHNQPRALPASRNSSSGKEVTVAPSDYGRHGVSGQLVASTEQCWILARRDDACGTVHVHFPRQGFVLQ